MSKFSEMTKEDQNTLIQKLGELLQEHGIDTQVVTNTEVVCNVKGDSIEQNVSLSVEKDFPSSEEEKVAKFNEAVKPLLEGKEEVEVNVVSKLGAGDMYKQINDVVHIKDADKTSLVHKEGEVWLLDFWATWCPPCQTPMAHNQKMLEERGKEWGNQVRIIGLSIDQDTESIVKHVESKKWESVEHYHRAKSDCSKVYSVNGVPHVMLIDQQGKIVFKGHPSTRPDLEKDLDTLRKGEKLTGPGAAEDKPAEADKKEDTEKADDEAPEGFKDLDVDTIKKELEDFKVVAAEFQKNDELKKAAKDMQRSFCVMVVNSQFNPKTRKTFSSYKNYRVLVGKQENIDTLQAAFKEKVTGSYEVQDNVHVV